MDNIFILNISDISDIKDINPDFLKEHSIKDLLKNDKDNTLFKLKKIDEEKESDSDTDEDTNKVVDYEPEPIIEEVIEEEENEEANPEFTNDDLCFLISFIDDLSILNNFNLDTLIN